ncbi:hypothetical protein GT037_010659 [Alternaria burnsii]|uniref:Heterokaryon incompatibility domain-containing protein n=1 Tax=Alternaria burnsii TaxID=1187904 RepID=A0A8H7AVK4_9PLEO|nr:uncharacterized protein GT037_010659 [Alternaria burnsii]KAF7671334.1 hypothetical protein GT037_010659 [Alternaria burnsii]
MLYKPLDNTKNEIRILEFIDPFNPISTEELIQCSIKNVPLREIYPHFRSGKDNMLSQKCPEVWDKFTKCVDLRDAALEQTTIDEATTVGLTHTHNHVGRSRYAWGDFEALSYTWGNEGDAESIIVNGDRKEVSKNLEAALRTLRGLQETRLGMSYWVDSLCIDQGNVEERNAQVKRMREIYGRARSVIVWLGQAAETDKITVETMHHLCRHPCVEETLRLPLDLMVEGWHALSTFARKPYWNRAWIIQELAMNHNSTLFLCGKYKLTRRMLRLGAIYCQELLQAYEDRSSQSNHDLDPAVWLEASRVYRLASLTFNPNAEIRLDRLLNLVRRADATDKRDKVYSILGLLDPAVSAEIVPNYKLSVQQIFTEFTKAVIKNLGSLDQIVFGGIPTQEGWPSWVPDQRLPFVRHHIRYLRSRRASGTLPASIRFCEQGRNRELLTCSGIQVDTVDGTAAGTSQLTSHSKPRFGSNRYSGRTSDALEKTLLMSHPGVREKALLDIPWSSNRSTSSCHLRRTLTWPNVSQSSYFEQFNEFRKHNRDFRVGGKELGSFFPQDDDKSVETKANRAS